MACVSDTILTNYEGSANDVENNGTTAPANCGQSFQIPADATVCGFSLYGGKGTVGTQPGTFEVEILSGAYDGGTVIATTGVLSSDLMAAWTSPAWYKFEFTTPVALTAGVTYYLKCKQLSGSTNDVIRWAVDTTSPTYSEGTAYRNNVVLGTGTDRDRLFRIHGVEGGGGGGDTPTCNNLLMMGV